MKPIDYIKPIPRIKIVDRTKNKYGLPTFLAMERMLRKANR